MEQQPTLRKSLRVAIVSYLLRLRFHLELTRTAHEIHGVAGAYTEISCRVQRRDNRIFHSLGYRALHKAVVEDVDEQSRIGGKPFQLGCVDSYIADVVLRRPVDEIDPVERNRWRGDLKFRRYDAVYAEEWR